MLRKDASLTTLLEIFSRGTHRVLVEGPDQQLKGIITDGALVKFFAGNVRVYMFSFITYLIGHASMML